MKYNQELPGRQLRFFDVLGNVHDIPFKVHRKLGLSFNVSVQQAFGGYARLFRKEKLFCFWIIYFPFVFLLNAEAVEALINGTKHMEKVWSYNFLHPWLGTGLLTSHGSKWKSRRKLLTASFHFDILKDFLPIFNKQAQILAMRLKRGITKDFIDIVTPVTLCSLDIICETTLGVSISAQENGESQYVKSVMRASDIVMERMANCWLWTDFIFQFTKTGKEFKHHLQVLHEFTRSIIREKKKRILSENHNNQGKRKRMALMDLLLEHHIKTKDLTEEDIREEVDTFAFEGHDTTSMGICWALYLIGLHKDVQEKVREELNQIFGDDTERDVNTDNLKDMKYLDCVLKESQRLFPSVPVIGRQTSEDTTICGYPVPKGWSCVVLVYELHRDESVFPNPEKFDPDRFLPENSLNRHPYAYIPFSAGPRNCIGQKFAQMEQKVIVSTILRHYAIESLDSRDKLIIVPELILRPTGPIRLRIRPNEKQH
ncbi:Cytochrome P450 4c3 like protein [Argiope bruennichi]|uniref:Cytochrome P450 4c3 like protein n=1 Tax=Argiope bruennichi TaxID=94029 RepID=A0A8T0EVV5_ARGBR|nr:Cytochrome P450 4c3 like protein [Argiope bruennichi]